ncbi:hypothetical protein [Fulvimarina sp. MAC8]|uniref:hypothetical protein n=1 Tax=Fulvimarina sp. MAC8 TaxID=3162874 RepID=UPI0032ED4519
MMRFGRWISAGLACGLIGGPAAAKDPVADLPNLPDVRTIIENIKDEACATEKGDQPEDTWSNHACDLGNGWILTFSFGDGRGIVDLKRANAESPILEMPWNGFVVRHPPIGLLEGDMEDGPTAFAVTFLENSEWLSLEGLHAGPDGACFVSKGEMSVEAFLARLHAPCKDDESAPEPRRASIGEAPYRIVETTLSRQTCAPIFGSADPRRWLCTTAPGVDLTLSELNSRAAVRIGDSSNRSAESAVDLGADGSLAFEGTIAWFIYDGGMEGGPADNPPEAAILTVRGEGKPSFLAARRNREDGFKPLDQTRSFDEALRLIGAEKAK